MIIKRFLIADELNRSKFQKKVARKVGQMGGCVNRYTRTLTNECL